MKQRVHKHILYEASVQGTDIDTGLIERIFRASTGRLPMTLREDFCGTALLACDWVRSHPDRRAWGVDLHRPTLNWARKHRVAPLGSAGERVALLQENVLHAQTPVVDAVAALNFSYMVFRERDTMLAYFRSIHDHLSPGGVFLLDLFGGPHAQDVMTETKQIPAGCDSAGNAWPAFTYEWEQARFNAVNQEILCYIHFKGPKIVPIQKAFTYAWRLWSINELRDLLHEAGFDKVDAWFEGWSDAANDTDGILRKRKRYEGMTAWLAYLGAVKAT